jgi:hypothetical protein
MYSFQPADMVGTIVDELTCQSSNRWLGKRRPVLIRPATSRSSGGYLCDSTAHAAEMAALLLPATTRPAPPSPRLRLISTLVPNPRAVPASSRAGSREEGQSRACGDWGERWRGDWGRGRRRLGERGRSTIGAGTGERRLGFSTVGADLYSTKQ